MTVASRFAAALPPWCPPAATEDLECALEALLFTAPEPLDVPELIRLLQHGEAEIAPTLRRLIRRYATRGLRVKEQQGRYCLKVAPTAEKAVLAYHQEPGFLSDAAYEVLALVAYLQPITAGRILELQGTDGNHALQTLQDAGLSVSTPGEESQIFFRTTEAFLTAAELTSLDELPPASLEKLVSEGSGGGVNLIPTRRAPGSGGAAALGGWLPAAPLAASAIR